jgi:hypothetical protein
MNHYPMTKEQRESLDHQLATIMEKLGDTAIPLKRVLRGQGPACRSGAGRAGSGATAPLGARAGTLAHNERERGRLDASARDAGSRYERQSSVAQSSGLNEVKWIDDLTFLANLEER